MTNAPYLSWGIALVSLVTLLLAIYAIVIHPWMNDIQTYNANIRELAINKARLHTLIAQRPHVEQQLARIDELQQQSRYFLKAFTSELANRELIDRINSIIQSIGGEIVSTKSLTQTEEEKRIKVRFQMRGDENFLLNLLHQLEGDYPLLFIENFYIRAHKRNTLRERGINENALDIRFDVLGFLSWKSG